THPYAVPSAWVSATTGGRRGPATRSGGSRCGGNGPNVSRYAATSPYRGRMVLALVCLVALVLIAPEAAPHWTVPDTQRADDATFWVAPDGNDDATGSADDPFRTPARARRAVRTAIADGRGAVVNLAG